MALPPKFHLKFPCLTSGRKHGIGCLRYLLLLLIFFPCNVYSQKSVSGVPLSVTHNINKISTFEVMPIHVESKKALQKSEESSRLKRLEFAHVFNLSITPENSGEWLNLENGEKLWRVGITSKGAFSLNMIFGVFNLEPDVKLFVYSPDYQNLLGAFSSENNNAAGTLAIQPIPGDSLIIEIDIPAEVPNYGALEVSKLGHDYLNIFGKRLKSETGAAISGTCNVDINCDSGKEWQVNKYAVCKLIVNARDLCTGTLINNTAQDKTPYVITAHHCIDTTFKAANTVFIFNYEKWSCGGQDGPKTVTFSGSQLIATTPNLDFSLVKLYGLPPFSVRPYFAGWDRSAVAPLNSATIHHPNGDYKKITIDNNAATSSTFAEDYNPNTHWLINKWEVGTTERGSSGAPLFNQNHLFVGDLTGGDATCASPVRDYFAKLSNSWADYSDWRRQLKHWLDPLNSNVFSLQGMDPYATELTSCDTFSNISTNEKVQLYNTNLSWGNYSGHNSQLFTQFAEKIDVGGELKIPGFYVNVAKAYSASPLSYITIKLWKGGDVPGNEISSRSIFIKDLIPNRINYLEFDSVIFTSGPVYLGFSVNYSATQDTFAVYQSPNRSSSGFSGMYLFKNDVWSNISSLSNPALYSSFDLGLVSCSLLNSLPEQVFPSGKLNIYPNPVTYGELNVEITEAENAIISVFSISGRKVGVQSSYNGNLLKVNTSNLNSGIYILKILIPGKGIYNQKFMVFK